MAQYLAVCSTICNFTCILMLYFLSRRLGLCFQVLSWQACDIYTLGAFFLCLLTEVALNLGNQVNYLVPIGEQTASAWLTVYP